MEGVVITNTLFSFKNAKSGEDIFRKAKYESLIEFLDKRTRLLEMNEVIILGGQEYKITRIVIGIHEINLPATDGLPYSYHVHVDVVPDKETL